MEEEGDYKVVAFSEKGVVMAIENVAMRCYGVQFHPESIVSEHGHALFRNFVETTDQGELM